MALCLNGVWEDVVLDDLFPCIKSGFSYQPAFNHTKTNELWVMLIEKAWAKVHGGYYNISAGLTREALRDLTGASAKTYFLDTKKDIEKVWQKMIEAQTKKFIMTAGSDDLSYGGGDAFISKIGLAGSHAYSLIGAYHVAQKHG